MGQKKKVALLLIVVVSLTLVVGCSDDDVQEKGILESKVDIPSSDYNLTELDLKVYKDGDLGGEVLKSKTITKDLSGTKNIGIKIESGTYKISAKLKGTVNGGEQKTLYEGESSSINLSPGATASVNISLGAIDLNPHISNAVVEDEAPKEVVLSMSEIVNATDATGFTVQVNDSEVAINSLSGSGTKTLTLTLADAVTAGNNVTLSYDDSKGDVTDEAGKPLLAVNERAVSNNISNNDDTTAPTLAEAVIEDEAPKDVVLTMSEVVTADDATGFTVQVNGSKVTIDSLSGSGSKTLTLTLANEVQEGDTVTLDYSGGSVTDEAGNSLADISGQAVNNNVVVEDTTAPTVDSAVVEGAAPKDVVLSMSEVVTADDATGFAVQVNGSKVTIDSLSGSGSKTLTLTLANEVQEGDTVTLDYSGGNVTDEAGNELADISDLSVTNNVVADDTTPPAVSGAQALSSTKVQLSFDEALSAVDSPDPKAFIISGVASSPAVTGAEITGSDDKKVELTLDSKVMSSDNDFTVEYAKTGTNDLQDSAGNKVEDFNQTVTNNVEAITFHYAMPSWGTEDTVNLTYYKNGVEEASDLSMTKNGNWYEITVPVEDATATTEFVIDFSDSGTKKYLKASDFTSNATYTTSSNNIWIDATTINNWGDDYPNTYYLESSKYSDSQIDIVAPSFSSEPSTANVAGTSFDINATLSEAGTVYYVVVSDGASAPNSSQVKAGNDASDSTALASGNKAADGSGITMTATGLSEETAYDVYVVAEDDATNPNLQGNPAKLDVTTADETAPTVDNAVVEDAAPKDVVLSMSETVNFTDKTGFTVNVNGSSVSINSISGDGTQTITLTLGSEVQEGDTVTLDYSGGNVTDTAGNELADITDMSVTNNVVVNDTTPPEVESAAVEDSAPKDVVITMSEPVTASDATGFTVNVNSSAATISSLSGSGTDTLTLTLASEVVHGDTVTLSYDGSGDVTDDSDNALGSFSDQAVTNNVSDTTAPTVTGAQTLSSTKVQISFDEALNTTNDPDTSAFSISGVASSPVVTGAAITGTNNQKVELTLDSQVIASDNDFTIEYTKTGTNDLQDGSGNKVADFSQTVTNNVEAITFHFAMPSWGTEDTVKLTYYKNGVEEGTGSSMAQNGNWYEITVPVEDAAGSTEFVISYEDSGTEKFLKASDFENKTYTTSTNDIWIDATDGLAYDWSGDDYSLPSDYYSDTELDIVAPSFSAGPSTANVAGTSFDINATLSEAGTVYYVVVSDGANAPSSLQVKSGNNASGSAALASGNKAAGDNGITMTATGLSEKTDYDVYVVAEDDATNPNLQDSPSKLDVKTADETAPKVDDAVVEDAAPKDVVLSMSETVNFTDATGFTVTVNGSEASISSSSGDGTETITLTLGSEVQEGDTVTLDYSGGNVTDTAGNELADITDMSVTNNVVVNDTTPPTVESAVVEDTAPKDVVITMSESVTASDATGFTVDVGGSSATISSLSGSGTDTLTLTLASEVVTGDELTLSYDDSKGDVTDDSSNALDSFSGQTVTNNTTVTIDGIKDADYTTLQDSSSTGSGKLPGDKLGDVYITNDESNLYIYTSNFQDPWADGYSAHLHYYLSLDTTTDGSIAEDDWRSTITFSGSRKPDYIGHVWSKVPADGSSEGKGGVVSMVGTVDGGAEVKIPFNNISNPSAGQTIGLIVLYRPDENKSGASDSAPWDIDNIGVNDYGSNSTDVNTDSVSYIQYTIK